MDSLEERPEWTSGPGPTLGLIGPCLSISFKPRLYWIISLEFSFVLKEYLISSHFKWVVQTSRWSCQHDPLKNLFRSLSIPFVPLLYQFVPLEFSFVKKYLIWCHFTCVVVEWCWHDPLSKFFWNLAISFVILCAGLFPSNFCLYQKILKLETF